MSSQTPSAATLKKDNKQGSDYLAAQSTFVAIATLAVLIRIYVRTFVVKKFGLDDAAIILAMVVLHLNAKDISS